MQIIHGTYTACIERTYGAEPTELTQNEEPLHIYVRTDIMRLASTHSTWNIVPFSLSSACPEFERATLEEISSIISTKFNYILLIFKKIISKWCFGITFGLELMCICWESPISSLLCWPSLGFFWRSDHHLNSNFWNSLYHFYCVCFSSQSYGFTRSNQQFMILFNFYIQRLEFGVICEEDNFETCDWFIKQLAFRARRADSDFGIILLTKRYV